MEKLLKHFACLLMVMLACVALPSCGGDDDDDDDLVLLSSVEKTLVGTWESSDDDGDVDRMTLNSDGTGQYIEHYRTDGVIDKSEWDRWSFYWSYNSRTRVLTIVDSDGWGADCMYVDALTSSYMRVYWCNEDGTDRDEDPDYWTKVN